MTATFLLFITFFDTIDYFLCKRTRGRGITECDAHFPFSAHSAGVKPVFCLNFF